MWPSINHFLLWAPVPILSIKGFKLNNPYCAFQMAHSVPILIWLYKWIRHNATSTFGEIWDITDGWGYIIIPGQYDLKWNWQWWQTESTDCKSPHTVKMGPFNWLSILHFDFKRHLLKVNIQLYSSSGKSCTLQNS